MGLTGRILTLHRGFKNRFCEYIFKIFSSWASAVDLPPRLRYHPRKSSIGTMSDFQTISFCSISRLTLHRRRRQSTRQRLANSLTVFLNAFPWMFRHRTNHIYVLHQLNPMLSLKSMDDFVRFRGSGKYFDFLSNVENVHHSDSNGL